MSRPGNLAGFARVLYACLLLASVEAMAQVSLLALDFELIDEMHDPATKEADQARLQRASGQMREELAACPAFTLTDAGPARQQIERAASMNAYLYRCNGCAGDIAQAAGADLLAFAWVQKVSNLILNFNIEVRDGRTEKLVAAKSVDLRGNTDQSWVRGVKALARRLCDSMRR